MNRSIFNQAELQTALHPYLFLTQAVRNGSIQKFNEVYMYLYIKVYKYLYIYVCSGISHHIHRMYVFILVF
jgi:hypothetical protein